MGGANLGIEEIIAGRRSIRQFRRDPVPEEMVRTILKMGLLAPSAGNRQPWHFYVVTAARSRRALIDVAMGQKFVEDAPVVLVVCTEAERSVARYLERGETLYCLQDTAAAIQNILLTVESLGLGACWIGAFDESECARVLSLPEGHRPIALIPVGYPERIPDPTPRRSFEDTVTYL